MTLVRHGGNLEGVTALIDVSAVVRRPAGVVRVSGPARLTYLHAMLSQHLHEAPEGTVADFLYLDPKGNAQAEGRAVVRAADVLLVTAPEVAAELAASLERLHFLMEASAADISADWGLASVRGPSVSVPGAPEAPMTAVADGAGLLIRDRSGGVDLLGETGWLTPRVADLGLPLAGEAEWEAWRIGAGLPAWGREIVPGRRPQELGLLPTHVHLRKGCYPGQESIAKVHNLGKPRRALAVLELAGEVSPGDPVELPEGGRPGEVTSAADEGEAWVALALVPLTADGTPSDTVTVGGEPAHLRHMVGAGLDQPGAD